MFLVHQQSIFKSNMEILYTIVVGSFIKKNILGQCYFYYYSNNHPVFYSNSFLTVENSYFSKQILIIQIILKCPYFSCLLIIFRLHISKKKKEYMFVLNTMV